MERFGGAMTRDQWIADQLDRLFQMDGARKIVAILGSLHVFRQLNWASADVKSPIYPVAVGAQVPGCGYGFHHQYLWGTRKASAISGGGFLYGHADGFLKLALLSDNSNWSYSEHTEYGNGKQRRQFGSG